MKSNSDVSIEDTEQWSAANTNRKKNNTLSAADLIY